MNQKSRFQTRGNSRRDFQPRNCVDLKNGVATSWKGPHQTAVRDVESGAGSVAGWAPAAPSPDAQCGLRSPLLQTRPKSKAAREDTELEPSTRLARRHQRAAG